MTGWAVRPRLTTDQRRSGPRPASGRPARSGVLVPPGRRPVGSFGNILTIEQLRSGITCECQTNASYCGKRPIRPHSDFADRYLTLTREQWFKLRMFLGFATLLRWCRLV
jgi:hypothetical protein